MSEPGNEVVEQLKNLVREVGARSAEKDWDAAERATRALEEAYAPFAGGDPEAVPWVDSDEHAGAAHLAFTGGRRDLAARVLRVLGDRFEHEVAMLDALASGDLELCAAYLVSYGVALDVAHQRLLRAIAEACATSLLERGGRDERLIAIEAMRAALLDLGFAEVSEDVEAWADARNLRRDPTSSAEALVRLSIRRREGPHADVFEAYAAGLGDRVRETPELFEEAATCARRLVERGQGDRSSVRTYALHAILNGREKEARAHVDAIIAKSRKSKQKRIADAWAEAEALAAEMRGETELETMKIMDAEEGLTRVPLGEFTVISGTLIASDPCYDGIDSRVQVVLRGARRGVWNATALSCMFNGRPLTSMIIAAHAEHECSPIEEIWADATGIFGVGVDSGQAGIFDVRHYRDEAMVPKDAGASGWYEMVCDAKDSGGAAVIPFGCVADSGYGDGMYTCVVSRSGGQIVGVAVVFGVWPEDDEETS